MVGLYFYLVGSCPRTAVIIYCIRHIFRESNFSRIGTLRHFREWLNSRSRRAMYCVHKSHSCVGIGGKYFRVLINSRIAPTREIRENKNPAKYMAYTVPCRSVCFQFPFIFLHISTILFKIIYVH